MASSRASPYSGLPSHLYAFRCLPGRGWAPAGDRSAAPRTAPVWRTPWRRATAKKNNPAIIIRSEEIIPVSVLRVDNQRDKTHSPRWGQQSSDSLSKGNISELADASRANIPMARRDLVSTLEKTHVTTQHPKHRILAQGRQSLFGD